MLHSLSRLALTHILQMRSFCVPRVGLDVDIVVDYGVSLVIVLRLLCGRNPLFHESLACIARLQATLSAGAAFAFHDQAQDPSPDAKSLI